ncbi:hypothetical protein [Bifidobacterium bifidum]|uniref:hypothetical protein n=1 Tax=Bifidobacterium bifidum TaxID=1681 RepID=UPI003267B1ED
MDAIEEFFSLVHVCNVVSAEGVMVAVVEDEASDAAALVVPTATADAGSPAQHADRRAGRHQWHQTR